MQFLLNKRNFCDILIKNTLVEGVISMNEIKSVADFEKKIKRVIITKEEIAQAIAEGILTTLGTA